MVILPKLMHTFNAISTKVSIAFLTEMMKIIVKIPTEKEAMTKAILGNRRKTEGITLLCFKLYYKATVIKYSIMGGGREPDMWINGTQ